MSATAHVTAQTIEDGIHLLDLATRKWRQNEEAATPKDELYIRECGWCDATYRCNRLHETDLRPAYALCTTCSSEFMRLHWEKNGGETIHPDEYDRPTYWPCPDASL